VLVEDLFANQVGGMQDRGMHHGSLDRSAESNHGSDVLRALRRDGSCDDSAQAVADEVNLAAGFFQSFLDGSGQAIADEQVRTLGIHTDAGKIRTVADA